MQRSMTLCNTLDFCIPDAITGIRPGESVMRSSLQTPVHRQYEVSATFTRIAGELAMKRNRGTEKQIIPLEAHEVGVSVTELARQHGVTRQTTYR